MKLIQPPEISGKIMSLIDSAKKELVFISPFNKIAGWDKLIRRIKKAQSRKVNISWYSRKNNVDENNANEVRALGIEPILIDDLHAKLYMNEKSAIFTSMNMSKISDDKSIDIGYITEKTEEFDELYQFFNNYIKISTINTDKTKAIPVFVTHEELVNKINVPQPISNQFYVNAIHSHIFSKYGKHDYGINQEWGEHYSLEYYNFYKRGYKLQFDPFEQAIKIFIYFRKPSSVLIPSKAKYSDYNSLLSQQNELEFNVSGNFVKYYFETPEISITNWNEYILKLFMKDLDVLIDIVFSNT